MSNRDLYKDEFGNFHEVEEHVETEELIDGLEDDEQDLFENEDHLFDSVDDDNNDDEDEDYASEYNSKYDSEYEADYDNNED